MLLVVAVRIYRVGEVLQRNTKKKQILFLVVCSSSDFRGCDNQLLGYGASWHPSKLQHQKMAKELLPFLKNLMNW